MNDTMTKEVVELLRQLHSAGQTGILILIVGLLVIVVAVALLVMLQRQTIKQLNIFSKETDTRIKAADSARLESRENQKTEHTLLMDRLNAMSEENDRLRQEVVRLDQKQDDLRESVREYLKIGLQEIREKLYDVSVKEILTQIPHTFRADLETELTDAAQRAVQSVVRQLREAPDDLINVDAIQRVAERTGEAVLKQIGAPANLAGLIGKVRHF